jgi:3-oxoacyl-[acyl-carrier protein] reductase
MNQPTPNAFARALDFSGKTALVVGGSSGIGNGIAQTFRQLGADVHVWGTRASAADYAAAEGSDLTGLTYTRVDVADNTAVAAARPTFGQLDVLVLSQGTVRYRREEFTMPGFDVVVRTNLDSMMACALKFHDMLAARQGALITVSSVAGFKSTLGNPGYSASKHGVVGLTASLGQAWARDGIRVNGIAPGLVDTKLTKVTTEHPERLAGSLRKIPVGRLGTPGDMAGAAVFLASPLSAYVVGRTLIVDGGLTLS